MELAPEKETFLASSNLKKCTIYKRNKYARVGTWDGSES